MRVILYTGKGGVGKTSVAAATALRAARDGHRTMLLSTDPAHSVADALDVEPQRGAFQHAGNLWVHEVDALSDLEANWARVHGYVTALLASQGVDEIVADELATPPGMGEVASLMWIRKYHLEQRFDVLVVDCAPTGETLQLLSFPEVARWWLNKVFPIQRGVMRIARPVLQPLVDMPLPKDEVFASIKDLLLDLDGTRAILTDPAMTSVRLVLNLEKMVIKEAQRAYTYLNLYEYQTDAVVVNRVIPPATGPAEAFMDGWRRSQAAYEEQVGASFGALPILRAPLFEREVVGDEMLLRLADAVFGEGDATAVMRQGRAERVVREGDEYVLVIDLPFVAKADVDLIQRDDELFIRVGPYKREITLPRVLARRRSVGARFDDGTLRVRFAAGDKIAAG
ncbi:MAG TPA: TRC40/GET3/ArsA family transport-energizing ATPase [Candidatus Dormibacteraeota bacterium]|jgi:arsenite-transporting ATPase|nr:TRC40/GET3/ArsA family transport-energizing ATPase [Candidatus Dormibacteraeota bacterium]